MGTEAMAETGEVDIYRDTPLRYLGYANEVGEAFRALMHVRWVRATYGVASAYVLADTYDKGVKQSKEPGAVTSKVAIAAVDTLLWQALASVIVPGFTINRICWGAGSSRGGCDRKELDGHWPWSWGYPTDNSPY